jgi:hypothetical protein
MLFTKKMWERHLAAMEKHFEVIHNAAIGQKMRVFKAVLGFALDLGVKLLPKPIRK